jgi:hypothetical protein
VKMKIVLLKKKVQYFHVSCSCEFCCERMNLLKAFSQFAIVRFRSRAVIIILSLGQ